MKRLLLSIILCLWASCAWAYTNEFICAVASGSENYLCNPASDYVGSMTTPTTSGNAAEDTMIIASWVPVCNGSCTGGNEYTAYFYHYVASNQTGKMVIYKDNGTVGPDSSDTYIGSATFTSASIGWLSATISLSEMLSCSGRYLIGFIGASGGFTGGYVASTQNVWFGGSVGWYSSLPSTLTGSWTPIQRKYGAYITLH